MPGCKVWVPKPLTTSQQELAASLHFSVWDQSAIAYHAIFDRKDVERAMYNANIWIFTSSSGVLFMKDLLEHFPNKTTHRLYVVGETTQKALEALGYCITATADFAADLWLSLEQVQDKATAFFCNAKRMDFFPLVYADKTTFREVPIYDGAPITDLTLPKDLEYIVALSPKTMQAIYQIDLRLKNLPVISIGKTTTTWLIENGITPLATCEQPSIENCLLELKKQLRHGVKK